MRLINVKEFLEREQTMVHGIRVDLRTKVFELCGEATEYAILSHPTEVDKRSDTELSEAINSMYRWCANLGYAMRTSMTTTAIPFMGR